MRVDPFKLAHWLNARKLTPAHAAAAGDMDEQHWRDLLRPVGHDLDPAVVGRLAGVLRVDPAQITANAASAESVIVQTADELHETRRLVRRDGIDFYNYYTMASPDGLVAPVILDILCPAGRTPALNNGHLEPAITVNLGPGAIHGRWGVELDDLNWQVLAANGEDDRWITGDSYVEPSFCPHSYSLVDQTPARIVSYTGASNLAELIEELNGWSTDRFDALTEVCAAGAGPGTVLDALLQRRLHDRASAAALVGVTSGELDEALDAQDTTLLSRLGRALAFDYRLLLSPAHRWDASGKTRLDVSEARDTVRTVNGYRVASMAGAPHLPDLVGAFIDVGAHRGGGGRLRDCAETHYLVTDGEPTLCWYDDAGCHEVTLGADGSAWVPAYVEHAWQGAGSVLKLGSGRFVGYQAWLELTNTFDPAATLRRGHRDLFGWGYDD